MMKRTLVVIGIAGCGLVAAFAAEPAETTSAAAGKHPAGFTLDRALHKSAAALAKHQKELESAIRENRTDEVKKHADNAAMSATAAEEAAKKTGNSDAAAKAAAAVKTAKELSKIGQDGTISENGALVERLKQEAEALAKAAGSGSAGSEPKSLGNTICPVSGEPLGSMGDPVYVVHDGYKIGLCCGGCNKKFAEDAAGNLAKAKTTVKK